MQARGDNLVSVLKAFCNSSKLQNAHDRASLKATGIKNKDERAIFFDYLTWFMVSHMNIACSLLKVYLLHGNYYNKLFKIIY